jgi:hypothetical protein
MEQHPDESPRAGEPAPAADEAPSDPASLPLPWDAPDPEMPDIGKEPRRPHLHSDGKDGGATMGPEPVRTYLEAAHGQAALSSATPTGGASPAAASATAAEPAEEHSEELYKSISGSYFFLRMGLAFMALAFPVVLWIGAGTEHLQGSISAYYHFRDTGGSGRSSFGAGAMRDVFVGALCAMGAFLLFYRGYSRREDIALNLAGIGAILVALFPIDWPDDVGSFRNIVHFTSAVTLFLAVAYVSIFRCGDTLRLLRDENRRRTFGRLYRLLGGLMVALPLSIVTLELLADRFYLIPERSDESRVIFWIEVAGIYVFSAFWIAKSREIVLIERQ